MYFKGLQKSSFIDYPGKISTVLFVGGCNFKCPYCHNSSLVRNEGVNISEEYIYEYLDEKERFIDGICISGGEPTLNEGIVDFIRKIKAKGFLVKLDTNGTRPLVITKLLNEKLLDYIAMDVKAPLHKYNSVVETKADIENIESSIDIIKNSGIEYEFRTTVCKELISKEDIIEIAQYLKGSSRYTIQNFRDGETVLIGKKHLKPYDIELLKKIEKEIKPLFKILKVRK